jgi:multiple sugar transport system permease protein
MRTLPVGLSTFQGQYKVEWNLLMAGSLIAMLPSLHLLTFPAFYGISPLIA